MDPNVCWERFLQALEVGDTAEALEARADLSEWLARKGFEPRWSPEQRRAFFAWQARRGPCDACGCNACEPDEFLCPRCKPRTREGRL
jgi:hypothetical protein